MKSEVHNKISRTVRDGAVLYGISW